MSTENTTARGIRLPDAVWDELDERAAELGMSRNEYIRRKLEPKTGVRRDVQKTQDTVLNGDLASAFSED